MSSGEYRHTVFPQGFPCSPAARLACLTELYLGPPSIDDEGRVIDYPYEGVLLDRDTFLRLISTPATPKLGSDT